MSKYNVTEYSSLERLGERATEKEAARVERRRKEYELKHANCEDVGIYAGSGEFVRSVHQCSPEALIEETREQLQSYNTMKLMAEEKKMKNHFMRATMTPNERRDLELTEPVPLTEEQLAEMWSDPSRIGLCSLCGMDDAIIMEDNNCKWCWELTRVSLEYVEKRLANPQPEPNPHPWPKFRRPGDNEMLLIVVWLICLFVWIARCLGVAGRRAKRQVLRRTKGMGLDDVLFTVAFFAAIGMVIGAISIVWSWRG